MHPSTLHSTRVPARANPARSAASLQLGTQADDENHAIALNYCQYHTWHHQFPDPDPYKVNERCDALRERFGIHAQLDKQEAFELLLGGAQGRWCKLDPSLKAPPGFKV